jgi:hypothetical protein
MAVDPVSILGGKSVYCINEGQLQDAFRLANEDPVASPRIQEKLKELEDSMSRNERAALAFVMIDRLLQNADENR